MIVAAIMSKLKAKETELIDIGKKLGKSQTKDALVKLLVVRIFFSFFRISNISRFYSRRNFSSA